MTDQPCPPFDTTYSPNNGVVVLDFRDPWTSFVVYGGEDVEHGKDTRDGETQHPDCQVASRTNPVVGGI